MFPVEFEPFLRFIGRDSEREMFQELEMTSGLLANSDEKQTQSHLNSLIKAQQTCVGNYRREFFILLLIGRAIDKRKSLGLTLLKMQYAGPLLKMKGNIGKEGSRSAIKNPRGAKGIRSGWGEEGRPVGGLVDQKIYSYEERRGFLALELVQKLAEIPGGEGLKNLFRHYMMANLDHFPRGTEYLSLSGENRVFLEQDATSTVNFLEASRSAAMNDVFRDLSRGKNPSASAADYLASAERASLCSLASKPLDLVSVYCLSHLRDSLIAEQIFADKFSRILTDADSSGKNSQSVIKEIQKIVATYFPHQSQIFTQNPPDVPINSLPTEYHLNDSPFIGYNDMGPSPIDPYPIHHYPIDSEPIDQRVIFPSDDRDDQYPVFDLQGAPDSLEAMKSTYFDQSFPLRNKLVQVNKVDLIQPSRQIQELPNRGSNSIGERKNDIAIIGTSSIEEERSLQRPTAFSEDNRVKNIQAKAFSSKSFASSERTQTSPEKEDPEKVARMIRENEECEKLIVSLEFEKNIREEIVSARSSRLLSKQETEMNEMRASFVNLCSSTSELQKILAKKKSQIEELSKKFETLYEHLANSEKDQFSNSDVTQSNILSDRPSHLHPSSRIRISPSGKRFWRAPRGKQNISSTTKFLKDLFEDINRTLKKDQDTDIYASY